MSRKQATLRRWLDDAGFHWETGVIAYQRVAKDDYPGWGDPLEGTVTEAIKFDHEILDRPFEDGYGAPMCPRVVCYDSLWIYFPYQYDGATGLVKVSRTPNAYIGNNTRTPYPGG